MIQDSAPSGADIPAIRVFRGRERMIVMRMTQWIALVLAGALCLLVLAGCRDTGSSSMPSPSPAATASPQPPDAPATPETATSETATSEAASAGYTAAGLQKVLEGCLASQAGSAGASLKAAIAANDLVRYTAQYGKGNEQAIQTDAKAWYDALDQEKKDTLAENWPDIADTARQITDDPEQAKGLLESAGVMTDFSGVDLETAAADLAVLDGVFRPAAKS